MHIVVFLEQWPVWYFSPNEMRVFTLYAQTQIILKCLNQLFVNSNQKVRNYETIYKNNFLVIKISSTCFGI